MVRSVKASKNAFSINNDIAMAVNNHVQQSIVGNDKNQNIAKDLKIGEYLNIC